MFAEGFKKQDGKGDPKAQRTYVDKIFDDIKKEIELYQEVQDQILKKVKINE